MVDTGAMVSFIERNIIKGQLLACDVQATCVNRRTIRYFGGTILAFTMRHRD
jgi:hypothetical protein